MYDKLIKALRVEPFEVGSAGLAKTMNEAADAIEELAAFKAQITDGHFYCMRDGVLYEAKVEMPKAKSIQLPRIEFAEEVEDGLSETDTETSGEG